MNIIEYALRALDSGEPIPRPASIERPAEPYRGAQYARANDGEEWLRLMALRRAGQRDMFGEASECPPHQWLRPDNGVIECATCGATREHYGD